MCHPVKEPGPGQELWISRTTAPVSTAEQAIGNLMPERLYRVRFRRDETAGDMRCRFEDGNITDLPLTDPDLEAGDVGIAAYRTRVSVQYVAIYTFP